MKNIIIALFALAIVGIEPDFCEYGHVAYPTNEWWQEDDGDWYERYVCPEGHEVWIG